ncbi:TonB-dependent receptor [Pedobacter africanus]|uniref:TonB-linked outer membrane protein, SusC/RagA family n=1 Tax=Pedobacter africanus TaxID=151894 RepID=A0A1W2AYC8_9SPHI|nr:TonB-dependent receptor [Pedobacter africanus]SMC65747.1 TonB-linked outer membrane protein, SusC/RagA family [Pedobacter africanus]
MKLTLILLLTALMHVHAAGYAQKITLVSRNVPLTEVLKEIRKQSGYSFVYNQKSLKSARNVNLNVKDLDIHEVLQLCFKEQPFTYEVLMKTVIIKEFKGEKPLTQQADMKVTGTVTDVKGISIPGVSVRVKGRNAGISTDISGKYAINAPENGTLVFSFIGYATQEVAVNKQATINVKLKEDSTALEELVVVGYGTVKKSSLTAAISKIENKNLDQIPAGRFETAVVGRMAGINISTTRARPGEAPIIRIRGASSLDAGNEPLIVIDGFPGGSLDNVNMNDVESMEVLKDASSAAIYGSRGSGGVIIITTKKGKAGKPQLNFNAYTGIAKAMGHDDWISGQEYYDYVVRYQNREYVWAGGDPSIPVWGDARRPAAYQVNPVIKEGNVNWQEEVLETAPIQNYNLSVSGGSENAKYYVSGTFKDERGTIRNTAYTSYAVRANVDLKINSALNMGFMLSPNYNNRRNLGLGIEAMVKYPPFVAVKNPDGTYPKARDYWGIVVTGGLNPMAVLDATKNYTNAMNNVGEIYVGLDILKGLKLRSSVGANITYTTNDVYQSAFGNATNAATGSAADTRNFNLINENVLSYNKSFSGGHSLSGILGASFQKSKTRATAMGIVAGSFSNDVIETLNNAVISPTLTRTSKTSWGLASYFGRINYDFKEKYLLAASMRTDGSSRFAPNNKWGFFPSASVAWRVSKEDFFKENKLVSNLKLRASYGVTGNFNIPDFGYLGGISDVYYAPNGVLTKGQAQTTFGNKDLRWEENRSYDVGMELGLFRDRINIVFDYYNKNTSDLLYLESIPATTGFITSLRNTGEVNNRGIELEINTKNLTGAFKWETSFNLTRNRNKVVSLGGVNERINTDTFGMSWILRVGEPMFSYYGFKSIGVLQDANDVANSPVLAGSLPGNTKYEDVVKDGTINSSDRVILGSFHPKLFMGMVNDFSWKNFDLSIVMQASLGAKMYNFENEYYQGALAGAMRRSLVETQWWSAAEPGDGKMPGAALSKLTWQANSDVYIEDASFLAVRNLNLGYTLPKAIAQKLRMQSFRIYTSISNPFMLTRKGFHGYNPEGYTQGEIGGLNSKPGYNGGSEPINRIYTLGLNVNF